MGEILSISVFGLRCPWQNPNSSTDYFIYRFKVNKGFPLTCPINLLYFWSHLSAVWVSHPESYPAGPISLLGALYTPPKCDSQSFPHPTDHWLTCECSKIHCGLVGMTSSVGSLMSFLKIQLVTSFLIYTQQSSISPNAFIREPCCPLAWFPPKNMRDSWRDRSYVRYQMHIDIFPSIWHWPLI